MTEEQRDATSDDRGGEYPTLTRRHIVDAVAAAICAADESEPGGDQWSTDGMSAIAADAVLALMGGHEPYTLGWFHVAKVLKDEAWEGRWSPLDESNIGPLAGGAATALVEGFRRLGLQLVAVESPLFASGDQ